MKKTMLVVGGLVLTALTNQIFAQQYSLGAVFSDKDLEVPLIDKPLGFGENLPKSVSLKQYAPSIGDQQNHGTCVGWSSTYTVASMEWAILNNVTDRSVITAHAYDPYHTYLSIVGNVDEDSYTTCESGTYISDACYHLYDNGSKKRFNDQLYCGDDIKFNKENMTVDFQDYYRLYSRFDDMETNVTAVCAALADQHPVVFGMHVPSSFFDIGSNGLFEPTYEERANPIGTSQGGHAMAIIGYDDEKFGGCFIVANSWGSSWGDDGYLYIKYDDFNTFTHTAYSFKTASKFEATTTTGCVYGNCASGYGIQVNKKGGVFEGEFAGSVPTTGIYLANGKRTFGMGKMYMKKMVKRNGG